MTPITPLPVGAAKTKVLLLLIASIVFGVMATLISSHYLLKEDLVRKGKSKTGFSSALAFSETHV